MRSEPNSSINADLSPRPVVPGFSSGIDSTVSDPAVPLISRSVRGVPSLRVAHRLDCADPDRVARFSMAALGGYDFPFGVPEGFATWDEYADANGIPEEQRNVGRTLVDQERDRPDIFS